VAAIINGRRFISVTVVPNGRLAGHVRVRPIKSPRSRGDFAIMNFGVRLFADVVMRVAGSVAEARYRKRAITLSASSELGDATAGLAVAALFYTTPAGVDEAKQGKLLVNAVMLARSLIFTHWADVTRVANALLKRGTLTEAEVRGLVRRKPIRVRTSGKRMRAVLMRGEVALGRSDLFHQ
jgi:hypothetical protein